MLITICNYDNYNSPNSFDENINENGVPADSEIEEEVLLEEVLTSIQVRTTPASIGSSTKPRTSELKSSSDKRAGSTSWKEKIKSLPPECEEIVKARWIPHRALLKSTTKSAEAQFKMLETIRLLNSADGYSWDEVGQIVEYAARHWSLKLIGSPRSLREWTQSKDRKKHEVIMAQIQTERVREREAKEADPMQRLRKRVEGS